MVGKTALGMRLGFLLLGMALVAACAGDGGASESTAPATTSSTTMAPPPPEITTTAPPATTTTTATTTAAPTTTTVDPLVRPDVLVSNFDRESVEDFDPTGDDLYHAVLELVDLFNYLEGKPLEDPVQMADLLLTPEYPFRDQIYRDFAELTDNGWRYVDEGIETVGMEVLQVEDNAAMVRVADRRGDQVIADATGETVRVYPGWNLDAAIFTFERGEDARWRYANVGEFAPLAPNELDAMVPVEWTGRVP